jgi:SAM-dependent methyltransferase
MMSIKTPARASLDRIITECATDQLTLDLGCGNSHYEHLFPHRVAVDISTRPGKMVRADACKLPFLSDVFSTILCTEVLEHISEPAIAIDEMHRVLTVGGRCVLSTRFCYPIHDAPSDFYRYTEYGLRYLFRRWHVASLRADTGLLGCLAPLMMATAAALPRPWRQLATAVFAPAHVVGRIATRINGPILTSRAVSSGLIVIAEKR